MKNVKIYIVVILIIAFIAGLYGLKLGSMGITAGTIILFMALFAGSSAFACGMVIILTKGIRKKMKEELDVKNKDLSEEYDGIKGEE